MFGKKQLICGILAAMMGCLALRAEDSYMTKLRAKAAKGDADAQFEMGLCCTTGMCVEKSDAAAGEWFRKAAAQGHTAARATCLMGGYGVKKDTKKAVELLNRKAAAGDVWVQFCLGTHYGSSHDTEKSFQWFGKAARQGNAWGQVFMGMVYLGIIKGGPNDPKQGVHWLRKAAAQGHPFGQTMLAGCYAGGKGVPRDLEKAAYWLRKAAAQGYAPAKAVLKEMGY